MFTQQIILVKHFNILYSAIDPIHILRKMQVLYKISMFNNFI